MDASGAGRLNRSSPSCLNRSAQRIDFFHGLITIGFVDEVLPDLPASFGAEADTAAEGGAAARVSIHLNDLVVVEPLDVRLLLEYGGGATTKDDHGPIPTVVTFAVGEQTKTIAVTATDDTVDDGESVSLSFVNDPNHRVSTGNGPATVALEDNDGVERVEVSFGAATYTATEGGADATVRVELDAAPGRSVTIPLVVTPLRRPDVGGPLRHSGERDVRGQPDRDDVHRDRDG